MLAEVGPCLVRIGTFPLESQGKNMFDCAMMSRASISQIGAVSVPGWVLCSFCLGEVGGGGVASR